MTDIPWSGTTQELLDLERAAPIAQRSSFGTPVSPVLDNPAPAIVQHKRKDDAPPAVSVSGGSGMIFLRRDSERGWFARFFGVKGVGGQNEMPLPCPIASTLAQVVERMQGKFPGCWLLVAP